MPTRRTMLGTMAALAGCLDDDTAEPDPTGAIDAPDDASPRGTVTLVQWSWAGDSATLEDRIQEKIADSFDLAVESHRTRRTHDASIEGAIAAGQPPETFETVGARALERYVRAHTIHEIPDLVPADANVWQPGVADAMAIDGTPYAVPITVRPDPWLVVPGHATEIREHLEATDTLIQALEASGRPAEGTRLALRDSARARFRLFCAGLLASEGRSGYEEVVDGEPLIGTLAPALERVRGLHDHDWLAEGTLPERADALSSGTAVVCLGDRTLAAELTARGIEYDVVRYPGHNGTVPIAVTGCPFPKRAHNTFGSEAVLSALATPACQRHLASLGGMLPARADVPQPREPSQLRRRTAEWLTEAEAVVPSIATGGALAPSVRDRARSIFRSDQFDATPLDELTRRLQSALS